VRLGVRVEVAGVPEIVRRCDRIAASPRERAADPRIAVRKELSDERVVRLVRGIVAAAANDGDRVVRAVLSQRENEVAVNRTANQPAMRRHLVRHLVSDGGYVRGVGPVGAELERNVWGWPDLDRAVYIRRAPKD